MERASGHTVLQHPLRSVSERQDAYSRTSHGSFCGKFIHVGIRHALGNDILSDPGIEYSRSVDAKEHAKPRVIMGVIHMRECIDTRFGIIVDFPEHSVHDSGRTCRRSYLTGIEHIEGQGIVRLVTGTVSNRNALCKAKFGGSLCAHPSLLRKSRAHIRQQFISDSVKIQKEPRRPAFLEIPKHSFRKSRDCRAYFSGELHCDVVPGKHYLIYFRIHIRLVILHPGELGSGEIARGIEKMRKAVPMSESVKSPVSIRHGTRVAPYYRRTEHIHVLVNAYKPVHLVRDAYCTDILGTHSRCGKHIRGCKP